MGMLSHGWSEEPTDNERFQEIIGYRLFPDEDLVAEIDKVLEMLNLTNKQKSQLINLKTDILEKNE